jgi:SAM-dependent methyltransferase
LTFLHKAEPVSPYSKLAPVYDHLMRHVDYERWAHYLCRLLERAEPPVRTVLDIACGTGTLPLRLRAQGLTVLAFDASFEMVRIARSKADPLDTRLRFWCGDMQHFVLSQPVDAVICTYDSLNYCLDLEGVSRVFQCVHHVLRPGGVFIFDVCTERNSRRNFHHYRENDECGDWYYMRRSYFVPHDSLQVNEFLLHDQKERKWYFESHEQRIYRLSELKKTIPSQFSIAGIYDGFTVRPGTEKSDRVHFLLRKDGSAC